MFNWFKLIIYKYTESEVINKLKSRTFKLLN